MARVGWSVAAREDLRQIRATIAENSPYYAAATVQPIRAAVQQLRSFPESGRVVPERPGGPYRELIVGSYRVVYRYERVRDIVAITGIIHGSREFPRLSNGG